MNKVTWSDRVTDATWTRKAAQEALTAAQMAWIVCTYHRDAGTVRTYEGRRWSATQVGDSDQWHATSITTLCEAFAHMHANGALLRAVIEREFMHGESYMPSTRQIGEACGVSYVTAWRLAERFRVAMTKLEKAATLALQAEFSARKLNQK